MNINLEFGTIVIAIVGAVIGGWASSYFQYGIWKKTEKANFMWEFRLKLFEAERMMWEAQNFRELFIPLNWLSVASNDPRVNIDLKLVDDYKDLILKGWKDLMKSKEISNESEFWGISTDILDEVDEKRNEINKIIVNRTSKLNIK